MAEETSSEPQARLQKVGRLKHHRQTVGQLEVGQTIMINGELIQRTYIYIELDSKYKFNKPIQHTDTKNTELVAALMSCRWFGRYDVDNGAGECP